MVNYLIAHFLHIRKIKTSRCDLIWSITMNYTINQVLLGVEDVYTLDRYIIWFLIHRLYVCRVISKFMGNSFYSSSPCRYFKYLHCGLFFPVFYYAFMVLTVGIGSLLVNGALIWLATEFVTGITIEGAALV